MSQDMTDEQLRLVIAEWEGYVFSAGEAASWWRHMPSGELVAPPDYPHDLNAVHEAEKKLNQGQKTRYIFHLQTICGGQHFGDNYFATARQRCIALVKTISNL